MPINSAGLSLIKSHEGLRLEAYKDPVGVWTIGFGHTAAAGEPTVTPGIKITKAEADRILARDLLKFEAAVNRAVTVQLNQNQFAALVSFTFNVGETKFRSSSVLKAVNAGDFAAVPAKLALWNKGGGKVLVGLVRRRKEEGALFVKPTAATIPAAVPVPEEKPAPELADVLMVGSRGPRVTALQQELSRLHYHPGGTDGIYGNLTRDAVMAFQADNSLKTDGMAGEQTWAALKVAKPRPLLAERTDATLKDLADKGSTIADASKKTGKSAIATVVAGVTTVGTSIVDHAGGLTNLGPALDPLRWLFQEYGIYLAGSVIVGMGGFIWYQARRSGEARLADHRDAKTL